MKRLCLALLVLLMAASAFAEHASAQRRGQDPEAMRARLAVEIDETITALDLQGDRAESVRAILVAQTDKRMELQTEMMAARGQGQGQGGREGMQAFRERVTTLEEETQSLLGQVLTEAEMTTYAELVEARQRQRPRRGGQVQ